MIKIKSRYKIPLFINGSPVNDLINKPKFREEYRLIFCLRTDGLVDPTITDAISSTIKFLAVQLKIEYNQICAVNITTNADEDGTVECNASLFTTKDRYDEWTVAIIENIIKLNEYKFNIPSTTYQCKLQWSS